MQKMRRILVVLSAGAFMCTLAAYGQDSPSLGEVARQVRLQKQQKDQATKTAATQKPSTKDAQSKDGSAGPQPAKENKVITNEEIPEHVGPTRTTSGAPKLSETDTPENDGDQKLSAEDWKAQIQSQKNYIASLESDIKTLNDSIQYAGANCVANCVEWNERQKQKQDQVESLKIQLEEQKKHLGELQDAVRKQGYGSSVYEP